MNDPIWFSYIILDIHLFFMYIRQSSHTKTSVYGSPFLRTSSIRWEKTLLGSSLYKDPFTAPL